MKHAEHKKQMDALKKKIRMMGEMVMGIADKEEEEESEHKKSK